MLEVQVKQGTPEWLQARAGVITASRFKDAIKKLKRASEGRQVGDWHGDSLAYMDLLACERISGLPLDDTFVTWQMRRGLAEEPIARQRYEARTGTLVEPMGLVLTPDRRFGYSTDGRVVDQCGGVEIKVPSATEKVARVWVEPDPVIEEYEDQIYGGMWLTAWEWIDLVIYTPWLESVGKDLWVRRFYRDEKRIDALTGTLWEFSQRVDAREALLRAPTDEAALPVAASATAPSLPSTTEIPESIF